MFSLLLDRTNCWTNNRVTGDLERHDARVNKNNLFLGHGCHQNDTAMMSVQYLIGSIFKVGAVCVIHQLYICYCINWSWSVLDQAAEGGSSLTSTVPAHLFIPFITGRGIGPETCWAGSMFPPDNLWIDLDTYTNCALTYNLHPEV